ncbi:MAG: hypothetical protein RPS47_13975 [Colwellia sp.]
MLVAFVTLLFCFLVSVWSSRGDVLNRFLSSSVFFVLFLPYEVLNVGFPGSLIGTVSPFFVFTFLFIVVYLFKSTSRGGVPLLPVAVFPMILFLMYLLVVTYLNHGLKGYGTIADNYLAVLICFYVVALEKSKKPFDPHAIYLMIFISALYSVFEYLISYNPVYYNLFTHAEWVGTQWGSGFYRSTGGIGHPLICATLYLIAFISLNNWTNKNKPIFYAILFLAIVATGSRAALVLVVLYVSIMTLRSGNIKLFLLLLLGGVLFGTVLYMLGMFDQIIYRFSNGHGSNAVRLALFDIIDYVLTDNLFGGGIGSTGDFSERVGFYNVIEVAWVSFIIEMGVIGTCLFFCVWYYYLYKNNILRGNGMLLLFSLVMVTSFNSLAVHSPIPIFFAIMTFLSADVGSNVHKAEKD